MTNTIQVAGLVGSLRRDSFNRALMNSARELAPSAMTISVVEIGNLPLFNQDKEHNPPAEVMAFKDVIGDADAVLFATPEYNYSVPGVLKNAIDWGSRPYGNNSFEGKPAAIMSASISMTGGVRTQYHLRQMMVFLNMFPLNKPEVMVPAAADKIKDGRVIDQFTLDKINELLVALGEWVRILRQA